MTTNNQSRNQVTDVKSLGVTTFATGTTFNETVLGGLSGITYDPINNIYLSISDDRSQNNPARFYTLSIDLTDGTLDNGDVNFTEVTTLLDSESNTFPENGIDPEDISLTENNTLYISSEGNTNTLLNPFVKEFSLSGEEISSLTIPDKFLPTEGELGIRNNLAFESLTISPDNRYLYTAVEQALKQDGTVATLEDSSYSRILRYDLTDNSTQEYVYEVESIPKPPNPVEDFADNGLVALKALDNNGTLLALERSFAVGVGNTIRLYEVETQGALDVSSFDDLYWEEEDTRYDIDPFVSKRLLADLEADFGIEPDNVEGMTFGPVLADGSQSLILVSDNNFSESQTTQFIALGLDLETIPAVLPVVETPYTIDQPTGDAELFGDSDDPAVWVNPENSADSLVLGTLKDGGLVVFSLSGEILQTITATDILGEGAEFGDIRYNNVDILYDFDLGGEKVDIAVASDRENDSLAIFQIDSESQQLVNITSSSLLEESFSIFGVDDGEATAYGLGGYVSPITNDYSVFVTQASGNQIAQLQLTDDGTGLVTGEVIRQVSLPLDGGEAEDYQSEAIVVDQEQGIVYLAVENELGIVKFSAEPNTGDEIAIVRPIDSPELTPDLEGLAIYYGEDGSGYLVASSQGDSSYAVYSRDGDNEYLGSFVIGDNHQAGIDQVNETDGLEIINVPLGDGFPQGALFVQDGANEPQNAIENEDELENNSTNFKFVPWEEVVSALDLDDATDTQLPGLVFGSVDADQFDSLLPDAKMFVGDDQILFTGSGDDYVDTTFAPGGNRIDLGSGNDYYFGGSGDRLIAGAGNDLLFFSRSEGDNIVTGGSGEDQFWLVTDTVDLPLTSNTITDFSPSEDVIGFAATDLSFDDLTLVSNGDSTLIQALDRDLAVLLNIQTTDLNANNFVFA